MKILFLSAANSIHTVKWVNALAKRGHKIYLVYNSGHEPKRDKIDENVELRRLKYGGAKGYYLNAGELRRMADKINPDVINVHYASGYGTLARVSGIKPILLSVWGSDVYDFPNESYIKKKILQKNVNYASKLASTSFCMAEQLKKVMDNLDLEIEVTPFGVDLQLFDVSNYEIESNDYITLGNIKMLKPKYGIAEFIKAVSVLIKDLERERGKSFVEKIRVEIYGDGEQRQELEELIDKLNLGKIVFLKGRIENNRVPEVLSKFDVFCATSMLDSESFGVAVVEAMAMEVPVVVTNTDGFKEVAVDGSTGFIVSKGNVDEIANALKKLIVNKSLREKFGKNGRKRVKELYDFSKNVDTMEELYKVMEGLK